MARYKDYSYEQGKLIPVHFEDQILPGTFEYTINYLIDNELDLSVFENRYRNEETGAPAYDPAILLKIVLFAYSRGITSSRKIARCCRENILFMALSADSRPHFTTIAHFISTLEDQVAHLFREVLLVCDELGLIGREMFAIDGCKLPSNASKEWSGTKKDFRKKQKKMERAIRQMVRRHRERDSEERDTELAEQEEKQIEKIRSKVKKIKGWLSENEDKMGKGGKALKSNITDNDSAKMKTSHGVIQGYDGVAAVDAKHQVVVYAEAFGEAQEHGLLEPMIEGSRENFEAIAEEEDVFEEVKLSADSGFHTEANMKMLYEEGIDGYVADHLFRKRDPRFESAERYKKARRQLKEKKFLPEDFVYDPEKMTCMCPAGKKLYLKNSNFQIRGYKAISFMGAKRDCGPCSLREQCLKRADQKSPRQVHFFEGRSPEAPETFTQKMKRKIDTWEGRLHYSRRLGIAEPVFGNICSTIGLSRFTLRGKRKVNTQWLLYTMVHNIGKIRQYGAVMA